MRTDAIIDKRQVRCPNASHIGYSKPIARVGDLITFTQQDRAITARMIGRVHYAPKLAPNDPTVKNWILAVCLNDKLDHTLRALGKSHRCNPDRKYPIRRTSEGPLLVLIGRYDARACQRYQTEYGMGRHPARIPRVSSQETIRPRRLQQTPPKHQPSISPLRLQRKGTSKVK